MLLAALAVFVVNLGLLFLQARAFKRSPRLGMLINFDAGIRYAFRLFYWVIPCALVLVSPAAPALKLLAVIATEMTYLVYGTVRAGTRGGREPRWPSLGRGSRPRLRRARSRRRRARGARECPCPGGERSVRQIALGKGPAAPLAAQLIDAKGSPHRR
jgi:hypothetical protein